MFARLLEWFRRARRPMVQESAARSAAASPPLPPRSPLAPPESVSAAAEVVSLRLRVPVRRASARQGVTSPGTDGPKSSSGEIRGREIRGLGMDSAGDGNPLGRSGEAPVQGGGRPMRPRRRRRMHQPLKTMRIVPRRITERLHRAGVITVGDFLAVDAEVLRRRIAAPGKATAKLQRWQDTLRLASQLAELSAREARLLVAVHRRSVERLAQESPARLHRDLQRWALSSPGVRRLRGRPVPPRAQVERWIVEARQACGSVRKRNSRAIET